MGDQWEVSSETNKFQVAQNCCPTRTKTIKFHNEIMAAYDPWTLSHITVLLATYVRQEMCLFAQVQQVSESQNCFGIASIRISTYIAAFVHCWQQPNDILL